MRGKFVKGAIKLAANTNRTADRAIDGVGTVLGAGAAIDGAVGLAKMTTKKTDPAFWNAYTGRRESGFGIAAGTGIAGIYAVGASGNKALNENGIGTVHYTGAKQNLMSDGVGHRSNAPTLGANGDIVFGLNNMRRG